MIKIDGTTITMTRGDTLSLTVNIYDQEGHAYAPDPGDAIRFAMKKDYEDAEPLIIKSIDPADFQLIVEPEDTKALEYGLYLYDVVLTSASNKIYTLLMATLELTKEGGIENADP